MVILILLISSQPSELLVFSLKLFKAWVRDVEYSIVEQLYLLLYLFYQAESFPDYNARRPAFP